jgi:hypothetical protein
MMPTKSGFAADAKNGIAIGDYPSLFRSSDAASVRAQRTYLRMQTVYLGSLVLGAVISALTALGAGSCHEWLYAVAAIVLAVGLLLLWVTRAQGYDKAWFSCRVVAESVKTATWRYMMRTPPFRDEKCMDARFICELQEIRKAGSGFEKHLAGVVDPAASEVTDVMKHVRSLSLDERKGFYLGSRVRDQKSWYAGRAKAHARAGSKWFWSVLGLEGIAITMAIIEAVTGGLPINLVPIITTSAAVIVAWTQTKRHDESAQAYSLAAQELGELESIASNVGNEDDFAQLVEQVEEAISREHTMWCARRDVLLSERGRA